MRLAPVMFLCAWLLPASARSDEVELARPLTVGLGVQAGMQFDGRPCTLAGRDVDPDNPRPDVQRCLLFAGGADLALSWRHRLGGAIGVYSSAGQASKSFGGAPAFPDRISVPLLLEVRPLAFLVAHDDTSYRGRALAGLALRLGPSLEIVRTASDMNLGAALFFAALGEIPLSAARRHAVALRLALHVLAAPKVALNGGCVATVDAPERTPIPGCPSHTSEQFGYGPVAQLYAGFVFYP